MRQSAERAFISRIEAGKLRHGVKRSITAIIRSDNAASCAARASGRLIISAARFMARLRMRGDTSPEGWLKKPDAPLAAQAGRHADRHCGSIYSTRNARRGRAG